MWGCMRHSCVQLRVYAGPGHPDTEVAAGDGAAGPAAAPGGAGLKKKGGFCQLEMFFLRLFLALAVPE